MTTTRTTRRSAASLLLEEVKKNPKTDYTYSASLTYRNRVTPERKVGSPNMSRKGLRGNIDYNQSSDFSDHSFQIDANSYGNSHKNFRSSGLPMDALSDSESESPPVAARTRTSRSRSVDQRPNSNGSIITTVTKSNYSTTKKTFLEGGLDEESDNEEKAPLQTLIFRGGTPLTASRGATPLISVRGGTPLVRRSITPLYTSNKIETNTRQYTNTLSPTPEEEENSLYRKIVSVPGAACSTVITSSKWAFSYIVTSVILMATRSATYISSSRSSSTATNADKLTSIADTNSSHLKSSKKSDSAFGNFLTTITTVITTITTTTTTEEISDSSSGDSLESVTTKVKRRPRLIFWIPLLLLLLLLAYWWLFLAPATNDDVEETKSLGYLLSLPFIKLYDLSSWLALSAYDVLLLTATKMYDLTVWLTSSTYNRIVWLASSSPEAIITASSYSFNTLTSVITTSFNSASNSLIAFRDNAFFYSSEAITYLWLSTHNIFSYLWLGTHNIFSSLWLGTQNIFSYIWLSSISIFNWFWSSILICLAYLLDLFSLIYATLQSIGMTLYGVLLSSASVFSTSPIPLASSNETLTEAPATLGVGPEADASSWLSFAGVTHSTSEMIIGTSRGLKQAAVTSQDWIWSSWVWIIASVGETVSNASGYTISAFTSVSSSGLGFLDTFLSLTSWGFSSLWTFLLYLWTGLWSGLIYLLTSLWTYFTSFIFTVAEFSTGTAAVLINTIKLISIPTIGYFQTSSENDATSSPVITPSLEVNTAAPPVALETMVEEIVEKVLDSSRLQDKLQHLIATHNKEEDVSALMRSVIEQEVSLVRAETTILRKEVKIVSSDSSQILGLKEQQASLVKQLDMLAAAVGNTNENAEKQQQFNDQLGGLRDQINILSQQLQNLQDAHTNLESEVSTCCKRASLTLADVERHVTTLLGDIFGYSVGNNSTGDSADKPSMATATDLNAWLKSYFVAKHDLEARLTALADSMEKATPINVDLPQETMEQTTQMVMETVMDKLRGEIRLQHEQLSSQTQETLNEQVKAHVKEQLEENVKVQVDAAAGKLQEQIVLDVQEQVKISKQELGSSLNAEVISIIADSVSREVSAAVPIAVSNAVSDEVASQVNGVTEKVIEEAVESSVKTIVSKEISSALADTVNAAVEEKISFALPNVVAESLPDMVNIAVTTSINKTVIEAADVAVAAAIEHLPQLNKGEKIKEAIDVNIGEAIINSGTIAANISLSKSNGNNSSFGVITASGLNEKDVQRIVKEALIMYDADKTGMVDHALESAGGNIISTRCTEGYQVHMAEVSILGWPIYRYSINNPRTIIQPDVMPGQCWAFKGSQGFIVIQLAGPVRPTGFTMEHIPKSLSPSGSIDSAPREFSVFGLESENGEEIELGNYEYVHDGESLQYFSVKEGTIPSDMYFPIVELKIKSNHGNMKYTCLYRFRVHGVRYF